MKAKYVGETQKLFGDSYLLSNTVHDIYVTAYDQDEGYLWLSIDEATYPWYLQDIIRNWEEYLD